MNRCLTIAALAAWCAAAWASPLRPCNVDNQFVADVSSLCIFYQCANGKAYEFACVTGSRVPTYYTSGPSNPCIVKVEKNVHDECFRYNVTDDPIPGAQNSNQCAQFQPCASRPGCRCVDQVAGYNCSCPATVTSAPTPGNVPRNVTARVRALLRRQAMHIQTPR